MITVLFLYRPVAWCFLRGMKKHKTLIISIVAAVVIFASIFIPWGKFWWTETLYYEDGSKWKETPYRFFREHGTEIVYRWNDGTKEREPPYVNGKAHGTQINYNRDGSKWTEEFRNGDAVTTNGTEISYNRDGSKDSETPYVKGKAHGTRIGYSPDGSKRYETPYVDGI